jgi:hypothetical protein
MNLNDDYGTDDRNTQDCYSHDICSYFNNASGGARYAFHPIFSFRFHFRICSGVGIMRLLSDNSDLNCGKAYTAAIDDTLFGLIDGCGQTNPSISPSAPTGTPVYV